MNKDLHDIDRLFYDALEKKAQPPSATVKERLLAALDKKDAESNKRQLFWWKRMALLLIVLLAGYILFDGSMLNTNNKRNAINPVSENPVSSPGNNTYQKEANLNERVNDVADINNTVVTNRTEIFNHHLNPSFSQQQLYTVNGDAVKKQSLDFLSATVTPESFFEYSTPEINKQLPRPVSVADRTSKQISILQHRPQFFMPHVFSKKPPGKIFRPFWEFSFITSYDQVGYLLDSDDPVALSNIKHSEVHEPSFSGGVLVKRQFNKHWGLQSGLTYSYTAIGISPQKIYAFQDPSGDIAYKYITSSGYAYIKPGFGLPPAFGDSLIAESKHTLQTIHIPLMVTYTPGKNSRKLTVTPGAGIDAGLVTTARAEVELTDASNHEKAIIHKLSGTKKFYLSAAAGVEFQYKLNKKISITLQPVFRHAISPITENNVVETYPRSFGIRAGLTFKL